MRRQTPLSLSLSLSDFFFFQEILAFRFLKKLELLRSGSKIKINWKQAKKKIEYFDVDKILWIQINYKTINKIIIQLNNYFHHQINHLMMKTNIHLSDFNACNFECHTIQRRVIAKWVGIKILSMKGKIALSDEVICPSPSSFLGLFGSILG
jgi:hypothetical protein